MDLRTTIPDGTVPNQPPEPGAQPNFIETFSRIPDTAMYTWRLEGGHVGATMSLRKGGARRRARRRATSSWRVEGNSHSDEEMVRGGLYFTEGGTDSHHVAVHSDNKPEYPCDFQSCTRGAMNPFSRKDHLRDHLRDYHRHDLGSAKRERKTDGISEEEIEAKWQRDQQSWMKTRLISHKGWYCSKCLTKTWVAKNGWICSNEKCKRPCEEERVLARLNLLARNNVVSSPKLEGMTRGESIYALNPAEEEQLGLFYDDMADFRNSIRKSPPPSENPRLNNDLKEGNDFFGKGEVPFTDSGYRSVPNLNYHLNPEPDIVKQPCPSNVDSPTPECPRTEDDAKTMYSKGSTVDPGHARTYIVELCNNIHSKLRLSTDTTNWNRLATVLPELIKDFAMKLCNDSPSESARFNRGLMCFIHKRHKEIAAQLEVLFHFDDEEDLNCDQRHSEGMSIQDKMKLWSNKVGEEPVYHTETDLFEGVQDDDDDPIEQSELSAYQRIILNSRAYEWFLESVATEAVIDLDQSQPRIWQQILHELPTGTVSKRRSPNIYEVSFNIEWRYIKADGLQHGPSELFAHFRSSKILTGPLSQAQELSVEQYLVQTWPMTGLKLLNALEKATSSPMQYCEVKLPEATQLGTKISGTRLLVTVMGQAYSVAECGEILAWVAAALLSCNGKTRCYCLPQLTSFQIENPSPASTSLNYRGHCNFSFERTPRESWDEFLLNTQNSGGDLVGESAIILGFPVRRRPEGYPGIELSFDRLLLFSQASKAEISVFGVFIDGPKRKLKLIKNTDYVFLWRLLDHNLVDRNTFRAKKPIEAYSVDGSTPFDYHTLQVGRHILSLCADNPAAREWGNISAQSLSVSQDYPKAEPSHQNIRSEFEIITLGPQVKNAECSELLKSDLNSAESQSSPWTDSREESLDSDMFSISEFSDDIEPLDIKNELYPILKNISNQLVAGFRRVTECNSSSSSRGKSSGTTEATASLTQSGNAELAPRLSTKRNISQDEEASNGDDVFPQPGPKKMRKYQGNEPKKSFACPFLKWDPVKYSECCVKKLSSISYIKQHLHRGHTPERYCQNCHSTDFPNDDNLQRHINVGKCIGRGRDMSDGISYQQRFKLSRKSKPKSSKEDQWYAIWETLFPGDQRPISIYIDTDLAMEMRQFREYCERHGPTIIREQLESSPAGLSFGTTAEQRGVVDRLIAHGLHTMFDNWGSRTSVASTSPEQARYETPTNSLIDSGVMVEDESPVIEPRLDEEEAHLPSSGSAGAPGAWPAAVETQLRGSSPLRVDQQAINSITIQSIPVSTPDFVAQSQGWETEFQTEKPEGTFDEIFGRIINSDALQPSGDNFDFLP